MAKRVFIIHGWGGKPSHGFKPWLKQELEQCGFEVFSPQLPNAKNPKMQEWLEVIRGLVGKPDGETYFVGHSLGCIAVMRYIESLSAGKKVGGAVLVAGFTDGLAMPELKDFFPYELDFKKIKKHCKKFVAIHSDNDYYIDMAHGFELEEKLGAKLIALHNKGHFSSADGITELPDALAAVLKIALFRRR